MLAMRRHLRLPLWRPLGGHINQAAPRIHRQWPLVKAAGNRARRAYATISASELQFGQPVHETHPHLLKAGELTPGITAQEYFDRRAALAASLPDNSVVVLAAADLKYRSGAVFYPYRQESNFLYLTGWNEPESVAVIRKTGPQVGDCDFTLLVRSKDAQAEQWMGPWSGVQAAMDIFNADTAADIKTAGDTLPELLAGASTVFTDIPLVGSSSSSQQEGGLSSSSSSSSSSPQQLAPALRPHRTRPLAQHVHQLRAIKSTAEVANMRRAGQVSGRALTEAMRRPWARERDLAAYLDHAFTTTGCDGPAYVPVVAGGRRGLMIHYVHNDAALAAGETVLVDAGGEYGTYVTDITRTWPVGGRFTPAQRDLYEAVLRAQRSAIALCRADAGLSLDRIHAATEAALRDQLAQLGFDDVKGSSAAMSVLFPHHVGHYIGLDVHDTPGYSRAVPLRAGHCVTIEPGVYVPDDDRWPRHFRGLAVRIEDSVCVGDDNPYILSTEAVKEVVDIEALRE